MSHRPMDSSNSLSRAFTKEALSDIAEWAVAYCLDTYGECVNEAVLMAPWLVAPLHRKKGHVMLPAIFHVLC